MDLQLLEIENNMKSEEALEQVRAESFAADIEYSKLQTIAKHAQAGDKDTAYATAKEASVRAKTAAKKLAYANAKFLSAASEWEQTGQDALALQRVKATEREFAKQEAQNADPTYSYGEMRPAGGEEGCSGRNDVHILRHKHLHKSGFGDGLRDDVVMDQTEPSTFHCYAVDCVVS